MWVAGMLVVQYGVYVASLALIAWHVERRTGRDAFALIPALAIGIGVSSALSSHGFLGILMGPLCAAGSFLVFEGLVTVLSLSLLEVLVIMVGVLALFDWATQHAPLAFGAESRGVSTVALAVALLPWSREWTDRHHLRGLAARVGIHGVWALRFWGHGILKVGITPAIVLLSFIPAVLLPLATTGVLSATILKDTALAMLFARVCGSRPPLFLLAVALTAGCLRVAAGFSVPNNLGPPSVEAALYLSGLVWLRMQSFRVGLALPNDR